MIKSKGCENKSKKNVNKYYLFKYLQSKIYILMNMGNSSIINNLSLKTLKNFNIELPNLTIQNNIEKIIQKLDKQLLKRKEQLKLLDELGESLFNATKIKLKNIKLSDVVNDIYAGKSLASKEPSNYKVIKTGAVSFEYFNETEFKYLPNDYIPNKNHFIDKGELLVSRMNTSELVGAVSYVFDSVKNLTIPDRIWKLILDKEQVNPIYLWYVLNESTFRKHVTNIATGTSGSMKNISQKNYLKSRVNLPEVNKQNEFAEKIEKIEELKKQCQKSLEYYEELYETLLHKAFNGELFNE
nr:restriction endonuclease subunit S [Staphylococcus warneri]